MKNEKPPRTNFAVASPGYLPQAGEHPRAGNESVGRNLGRSPRRTQITLCDSMLRIMFTLCTMIRTASLEVPREPNFGCPGAPHQSPQGPPEASPKASPKACPRPSPGDGLSWPAAAETLEYPADLPPPNRLDRSHPGRSTGAGWPPAPSEGWVADELQAGLPERLPERLPEWLQHG